MKAGSVTKAEVLLPLLKAHLLQSDTEFHEVCSQNSIDVKHFASELLSVISPSASEGLEMMRVFVCESSSKTSTILQLQALQHIKDIWDLMKLEPRTTWAATLIDVAVMGSQGVIDEAIVQDSRATLAAINIPVESLQATLDKVSGLFADTESPSAKRRKTTQGAVEIPGELNPNELSSKLVKLTAILELVESAREGDNLVLLSYLSRILQDIYRLAITIGKEMSYVQLMLLVCMRRIVEKARIAGSTELHSQSVRVDLVIDCFRDTSNSQVQNAALLLLSSLATLAPHLIIHSVMPIFTFMGSTVLKQTDQYSARVVSKTIDSIIPPLMASFGKRTGGPLTGASELLSSFVAAFEHIPNYRRSELLAALMERLGPGNYLHVLLIILSDQYCDRNDILEFSREFAAGYKPVIQLRMVTSCVDTALDTIRKNPQVISKILPADKTRDKDLTFVRIVRLSSHVLRSIRLRSRTAQLIHTAGPDAAEIRSLYSNTIEQTLKLANEAKSKPLLQSASSEQVPWGLVA